MKQTTIIAAIVTAAMFVPLDGWERENSDPVHRQSSQVAGEVGQAIYPPLEAAIVGPAHVDFRETAFWQESSRAPKWSPAR